MTQAAPVRWSVEKCPGCGYSLAGLADRPCPECGLTAARWTHEVERCLRARRVKNLTFLGCAQVWGVTALLSLITALMTQSGVLAVVLLVSIVLAVGCLVLHEQTQRPPTTMLQARVPAWKIVFTKLGLLAALGLGTIIGTLEAFGIVVSMIMP